MRLLRVVLAALMLSAMAQGFVLAQDPQPRPLAVGGVITAIDAEKMLVTLNGAAAGSEAGRPAPKPVVFRCTDKTEIIKNGKPAAFSALAIKDCCKALVVRGENETLVAVRVEAVTPRPPIQAVRGQINAINNEASTFDLRVPRPEAEPMVLKFAVVNDTKIIKNGQPATLADLAIGDFAAVRFVAPPPSAEPIERPIPALFVEARSAPLIGRVKGTVVAISDRNVISVKPLDRETPVQFQVVEQTKITKWNPAPIQALLIGDTVEITFNMAIDVIPTPAITVFVLPEFFRGLVSAVDLEHGTVTLQPSLMGPAKLFKVVEATSIIKNGLPVPLSALRPKDLAEVKFFRYKEIDVAAMVHAQSPRPGPGPR